MQAIVDSGAVSFDDGDEARAASKSTVAELLSTGVTTLSFSCSLPNMESLISWPLEDDPDADAPGLIAGNLYRREGYLTMTVPIIPDHPDWSLLVVDAKIDGQPWIRDRCGAATASTELNLHGIHPRDLKDSSRLALAARGITSTTAVSSYIHHLGNGLDDAIKWVNDRRNNAPEIRRLRRLWNYVKVAERMGE